MALANPCPESPIPWREMEREREIQTERGGERDEEERVRETERMGRKSDKQRGREKEKGGIGRMKKMHKKGI